MGMLMNESFYSLPEKCGMEATSSCTAPGESIDMGCCDDENLAFRGIEIISHSKQKLSFNLVKVVDFYSAFNLATASASSYKLLSFFPPPDVLLYGRNLLIQVQRFLI